MSIQRSIQLLFQVASLVAGLAGTTARAEAAAIDTRALIADECPDMISFVGTSHVICGRLRVHEGPDDTGRELQLSVVVMTPKNADAAKRIPTIFLHGGPAVSIVDQWVSMESEPYARDAPFILFDQRGVGRSTPKLCPGIDEPTDDALDDPSREAQRQVAACVKEAAAAHADLNAYGTDATVRDMESIRKALHIESWNVMGVSYGTTVALAYIAAHPDYARAAVLDSAYPPETAGMTAVIPSMVASLQKLNALCAAQPRCHARFGDVQGLVEDTLLRLEATPFQLRPSANGTERSMSSSALFQLIQGAMMETASWYMVPKFVDDVRQRRDTKLVDTLYDDAFSGQGLDTGIWMATECRERAPFDRALAGDDPRWPSLSRAAQADVWIAGCANWPVKLPANWQTPHDVSVPTLVIAGGLDPITPAVTAQATVHSLGNKARLLVLPYTSHSSSSAIPCVKQAIMKFLRRPDSREQADCARTVSPPEFAVDLIKFDQTETMSALLQPLGVKKVDALAWAVTLGLFSILIWPLQTFGGVQRAQPAPVWEYSSIWLSGAAALLFAWLAAANIALGNEDPSAAYWGYYGIPVHQWPTLTLIVPAMLAGAAGVVVAAREIAQRRLSRLEILHRAWVIAALAVSFVVAWKSGALSVVLDQLRDISAMFQKAPR